MEEYDYFGYNTGTDVVPSDVFRISPSQISKFFDSTTNWYREHLLGESGFTGNTNTALGNCVHAAAEMYVREGTVRNDLITNYVVSLDSTYDKSFILEQYPGMANILINDYLRFNMPDKTELFLATEVIPSVWCGGSLDGYLSSGIITDYKTTSSKTPPKNISRPYWFQQMTYAWIARKLGMKVDSFRLIYITTNELNRVSEKTGKPLKDYPSTVTVLNHVITDLDIEIIDNSINLIAKSVDKWNTNPELRYLLAQDMRLQLPQKRESKFFNKGAK